MVPASTINDGCYVFLWLFVQIPLYGRVFRSCCRGAPPGASGRVSGVMWAPSIWNRLRSIVGAPVSWLPLTRELPKGEGEKSLRFVRVCDESYRFSDFFLSFRRPHLPHQRKAQAWKPLLLNFIDEVDTFIVHCQLSIIPVRTAR